VITGAAEGSEFGHAPGKYSHASGYKVDLRPIEGLAQHIAAAYAADGRREGAHGGPRWKGEWAGNEVSVCC
jgi:hypothetical protein